MRFRMIGWKLARHKCSMATQKKQLQLPQIRGKNSTYKNYLDTLKSVHYFNSSCQSVSESRKFTICIWQPSPTPPISLTYTQSFGYTMKFQDIKQIITLHHSNIARRHKCLQPINVQKSLYIHMQQQHVPRAQSHTAVSLLCHATCPVNVW